MANSGALTLFVLSLVLSSVVSQTFQYSRGWTNGKRSSQASLDELINAINKNAGQSDNAYVNCELQKYRLYLQENGNEQVLQIPCEILSSQRKSYPETAVPNHFR